MELKSIALDHSAIQAENNTNKIKNIKTLKRQQWDLNPRGRSPLDFESNALDHSAILSVTGKRKKKEKKKRKQKVSFTTYGSQVVPHLSTRHAQWCLTSEFEWDPVFPPWYDRMTIYEQENVKQKRQI